MLKRRILVLSGLFVLFLAGFHAVAFGQTYAVKKGDSLYKISQKTGVGVEEIKKFNQLHNNRLKPGQVLQLSSKKSADEEPAQSSDKPKPVYSYTIQKGDTLGSISKKTGIPIRHIVALNKVNSRKLRVGRHLVLSKTPSSVVTADLKDEENILDDDDDDIAPPGPSGEIADDSKTHEEFLGMWGSPDERKLFVKVTTGFLGAPYRLGGATVRGIDCSAFVRKMYEMFDVNLPRTAREQAMVGVRVDRDKLEEGDLVFFRTRKPIGHVGIYIGNNKFVHASYKSKAVRIDNLDMPYFQKRYLHAVRVKGLEDRGGT